ALPGYVANGIPSLKHIGIDGRVLVFTLLACLATGTIFGLAPALQASKPDLNEFLKEGGGTFIEGIRRGRLRSLLVVSEMALTVVLLISAGLMVRSFLRLMDVNPGFRPERLLTAEVALPGTKYSDQRQVIGFYKKVIDQVKSLPDVQSAGAAS